MGNINDKNQYAPRSILFGHFRQHMYIQTQSRGLSILYSLNENFLINLYCLAAPSLLMAIFYAWLLLRFYVLPDLFFPFLLNPLINITETLYWTPLPIPCKKSWSLMALWALTLINMANNSPCTLISYRTLNDCWFSAGPR